MGTCVKDVSDNNEDEVDASFKTPNQSKNTNKETSTAAMFARIEQVLKDAEDKRVEKWRRMEDKREIR
tara:strand:- start:1563 stop:1766 length:204 start_codon:yes stop_codon:yes gene_type:complete